MAADPAWPDQPMDFLPVGYVFGELVDQEVVIFKRLPAGVHGHIY